ncbi:hypothetical protein L7F22_055041 [Adiantum nelumboides]|nr:hypothetical protein [Adiantum nelumboides]
MADNNEEGRIDVDSFDFANEGASEETPMLVNYLITRLQQAMANPALQCEVQQQLQAYGFIPPHQEERIPEKSLGETSKRGTSKDGWTKQEFKRIRKKAYGYFLRDGYLWKHPKQKDATPQRVICTKETQKKLMQEFHESLWAGHRGVWATFSKLEEKYWWKGIWLRIAQVIASSLIVGSLWLHSSASTASDLADQIGLLFFMSTFWTFFPLFTAIFTFPQERSILAKERASDMYRLSAYFIARTLSDVFLELGLPIAFLLIVYFMASLRQSAGAFFFTLLTIFSTIITSQGLGISLGAAMMDVKKATSLASVILLAFMLAGGFFIQGLPPFIAWIRYVSINFYAFQLHVKVQYHNGQDYNCGNSQGCENIAASPALHNIPLGSGTREVLVLIAMAVGYHVLAYYFLSRMKLSVGGASCDSPLLGRAKLRSIFVKIPFT